MWQVWLLNMQTLIERSWNRRVRQHPCAERNKKKKDITGVMWSINEKIKTSPDVGAGKLTVTHPSVSPSPRGENRPFTASETSQDSSDLITGALMVQRRGGSLHPSLLPWHILSASWKWKGAPRARFSLYLTTLERWDSGGGGASEALKTFILWISFPWEGKRHQGK